MRALEQLAGRISV